MTNETESEHIGFEINPQSPGTDQIAFNGGSGSRERYNKLAEEYGFPSRAAFLRHMVQLGMNTLVEQDPTNKQSSTTTAQNDDPVTIRELIPEGEENAVDITSEFWEEILRDEILDIVEQDPEIKRNGFYAYK